MLSIKRLPASLRFILFTVVGVLVWNFRSAFLQDLLLIGSFFVALWRNPRGFKVWLQPAGLLFLLSGLLILVLLPLSPVAGPSFRELLKYADVMLATLAIPALFPTRHKIEGLLFYGAWAIVAVLSCDLARMVATLGPQVFQLGHELEPFAFGHSNLSAMMGGAACLVLLTSGWMLRERRWAALGCLVGVLICLAHEFLIASRGPQVALMATVGLAAVIIPSGWRLKVVLTVLMLLAVTALVVNIERINPRFSDRRALRSFAGREVVWSHTPNLVRERPVWGHGWGTTVFEEHYHRSNPPQSPSHFHHAHQYWLQVAFATGWVGVALHLLGWVWLLARLLGVLARCTNVNQRLLPALIILLIAHVHIYGMADWPAGVVGVMMTWLIPVGLVVTSRAEENR
ncbi:MAG: O-antigen ligase family protein [Lentisphaerae bacterium]|nr:O-antigen ligase family protein [Lentisphaerota bacterium]